MARKKKVPAQRCTTCGKIITSPTRTDKKNNINKINRNSKKYNTSGTYTCRDFAFETDTHAWFLRCKRTDCAFCNLIRTREFYYKLSNFVSFRNANFITLTFDYDIDEAEVQACWKRLWERIKYHFNHKDISYFYVLENTKKNRIHLHAILNNCSYIPQHWLSEHAHKSGFGTVCYISKLSKRHPRYIIKYFYKDLSYFKRKIRYSQNFFNLFQQDVKVCEHAETEDVSLYFVERFVFDKEKEIEREGNNMIEQIIKNIIIQMEQENITIERKILCLERIYNILSKNKNSSLVELDNKLQHIIDEMSSLRNL